MLAIVGHAGAPLGDRVGFALEHPGKLLPRENHGSGYARKFVRLLGRYDECADDALRLIWNVMASMGIHDRWIVPYAARNMA